MKLFLVLTISLMLWPEISPAQDTISESPQNLQYDTGSSLNPVSFQPEKISQYKAEKAFDYLEIQEQDNWWTRLKRWVNTRYQQILEWLFGDYEANTILAFLLRVLPYLLIGALVGLIFWLFIRLDPGNTLLNESEKPEVFYNDEEKIVRSQNIPQLIEEAISQGNYRLAIRYYYLQLLKLLNDKEIIKYESQKTNSDYLNEIKKDHFRQPLKNLMRIYDFSWYGGFSISEGNFRSAQQSFLEMESLLKTGRDE